jgi:ADP-ribose pyrophosphatase
MAETYLDRLPQAFRKTGAHEKGEIELLPPDGSGGYGIVYEDKFVLLIRDRVRFPDGNEGGYLRLVNQGELDGSAGAVMIPVWKGAVIFIRIFRHATRSWEWELPRGFHEAGLPEADNAKKEIKEELGVDAASARKIGSFNANTGILTGLIGVYAVELSANPLETGTPQSAEGIGQFKSVAKSELPAFIAKVGLRCGISLAALMLYANDAK